jgi:hypothetical protein
MNHSIFGIIYELNKNVFREDHVCPSVGLSLCDLVSAGKVSVELLWNLVREFKKRSNKSEFRENRPYGSYN